MSLLRVEDLQVEFRTDRGVVRAVDGVSFTLEPGQTLGIVGESGSGKSVTCSSIMGLVPSPPGQLSGRIFFEGQDLRALGPKGLRRLRGNDISMIFQDPMTSLNPYLKVGRQLTEVLALHQRLGRRAARRKAIEMLDRVGIPAPERRFEQYPHQFSGGMRQRVMIAMALLCAPKLLIADEPTTALDVTIQAQILALIKDLSHTVGTSVILVTHDLGVVAGMADEIMVMYAGKVVERAPAPALFAQPAHPYTRGLLDAVPRLDGAVDQLVAIPGLPPVVSALGVGCPFSPRCSRASAQCGQGWPEVQAFAPGQTAHCFHPLAPVAGGPA
jgi:oligopeptide transport system ATP-binding protein